MQEKDFQKLKRDEAKLKKQLTETYNSLLKAETKNKLTDTVIMKKTESFERLQQNMSLQQLKQFTPAVITSKAAEAADAVKSDQLENVLVQQQIAN